MFSYLEYVAQNPQPQQKAEEPKPVQANVQQESKKGPRGRGVPLDRKYIINKRFKHFFNILYNFRF